MTAFLESTAEQIERRLAELKTEMSKLEAARNALGGDGDRPEPQRRRAKTRDPASSRVAGLSKTTPRSPSARSRPRRRSGARAARAIELVQENPGITVSELAKAMNSQASYLYRVLPRLATDGVVKREGRGWHPVS